MRESRPTREEFVKVRGPLTFMSTTKTRRGRFVSSCVFDVPDEPYGKGFFTGIAAAGELLDAMRRGTAQVQPLESMLAAAAVLHATKDRVDGAHDARGAAAGFMRTLEEALGHLASSDVDLDAFVARKIQRARLMSACADASRRGAGASPVVAAAQQEATMPASIEDHEEVLLADVIAMPGAAATPAPNPTRRGRYPQGVASLAARRRKKEAERAGGGPQTGAASALQPRSIDDVIDALRALKQLGLVGGVVTVVETPDGEWRHATAGTFAKDCRRGKAALLAMCNALEA